MLREDTDHNNLRLRVPLRSEESPIEDNEEPKYEKAPFSLTTSHFILIFSVLGLVYLIIIELEKQLPQPLTKQDEISHPDRFIAERAMSHVLNLTSLGPRPVGSFSNEVLAVNFLTREINSMIKKANKIHRISIDVQKTSGAFPLTFLDGMTNVYRNVQNVIAKIGPLIPSPYSLLINCHFDTVADSPGGSDDSASCAVMLEMLRIISQLDTPLNNNIIFLFNGAEENLMQASHGFITQHKWAKEIKAFVNLEACGAGGRELLFQAGPENPWLMQAYSESVPYPLASSLAQEVFQSGVIPGDTDYRIFRDFGNIPGLDFAWSANGYVYHTKLDDAAHVPLGSLQRTGDNMLPLVLRLANAPYPNHEPVRGNLVFFDVLGAFIIRTSETIANIFSISILCFSIYTVYLNYYSLISKGVSGKVYLKHLFISIGTILLSWVLSLLLVAFVAALLTQVNRSMSWYSKPIWILFLYVIPTLLVPLCTIVFVGGKQKRVIRSQWTLFHLYSDGNQLIWTTVLAACVGLHVRSGFIPAMWLLFATVSNFIRLKLMPKAKGWKWLAVFIGMMLFPFIQGGYIVNGALLVVIPIMGRSGSGNHSEIVLALIACAIFLLLLNFIVPAFILLKDSQGLIKILCATMGIAILALVLTPFGFPYSSDYDSPSLQRYMILHVDRSFHGSNGELLSHSGGFWVVDLDVNSPRTVRTLVPEMSLARPVLDCNQHLYCGLPYIIPVLSLIWKTHWIPSTPPVISIPTELKLTNKELRPNGITRLTFRAIGPDHMNVMVSPFAGVELESWSLVEGPPLAGPKWNSRETYFVYYSCASNPKPWIFWMDLKVTDNYNGSLIDIALCGHFLHGPHQSSVKLNRLLSQFPAWAVTSGWTATYKSYLF